MGTISDMHMRGGFQAALAVTLQAGQTVGAGRYLLKRPLGQGGMGVVWLAQDRLLRESVALKFLPPQIQFDPAALDGLRRETLRSRQLSHPNIIRIHDLHDVQDEPVFLSMEFVDGPNLHALRARRASRVMSWKELAPLAGQLCAALDYAHGERVIHRDLKPANLMLDPRGRLKLADFGLARVVSDSMSRLTETPHTSGTLAYMSPQQADGQSARVPDDLYALGATLYDLLTSTPPFHSGDVGYQIRHAPPDPPFSRLAELNLQNPIPDPVASLLLACLAKDPDRRPQSARAILNWLESGPPALAKSSAPQCPSEFNPSPMPERNAGWVSDSSQDQALPTADSSRTLCPTNDGCIDPSPPEGASWLRPLRLPALALGLALGGLALLPGVNPWLPWGSEPASSNVELPAHPLRTAAETASAPPVLDSDGFETIFNGFDLSGWRGDADHWSVQDGVITAVTSEEGIERRHNSCLVWENPVGDFELRLEFKLVDMITAKPANSGVLYRCRNLEGWEYRGYQFDLHGDHTGKLLLLEGADDPRTPWGASCLLRDVNGQPAFQTLGTLTDPARFEEVVRHQDWNELSILAQGNRLVHRINGVMTAMVVDESSYAPDRAGSLALELKRATHLEFRNIRIKRFESTQPGN